jgi:hypothetical protein
MEGISKLNDDALSDYNQAMANLCMHTDRGKINPLTFQLSTSWDDSKEEEKKTCIDKATEACSVICCVIAPKDGEKLFQAIQQTAQAENVGPSEDLIAMMSAYRDASSNNIKTQILSIYAYTYPMKVLQSFHEPYEKISLRQIKQARAHAKQLGPGSIVN